MSPHHTSSPRVAFTLVELLVSMAVLSIIMLLLFQMVASSSTLWTRTAGNLQTFQTARGAFESMTRNLSQATLQNYYGYADSEGNPVPLMNPSYKLSSGNTLKRNQIPTRFARASELHFVSGPASTLLAQAGETGLETPGDAIFFQAPLGFSDGSYQTRPSMLNVCGYYVQYERDDDNAGKGTGAIPAFASSLPNGGPKATSRYRLMEVIQPADQNGIYGSTNQQVDPDGLPVFSYDLQWLKNLNLSNRSNRHVLGDNILFLVILPKLAREDEILCGGTGDGSLLSPSFTYDTRSWEPGYTGAALKADTPANQLLLEKRVKNRLPPLVEVIMVAVDERSAQHLETVYGTPPLANGTLLTKLNLNSSFSDSTQLRDKGSVKGDLSNLKSGLDSLSLNYRIFHTEVRLPGASYGE